MAAEFARRDTPLETWDAADPNRKMALEETPWLVEAQGGKNADLDVANVLDPRIAKAVQENALGKLRKAQTAEGAFPWWPGGPPSPYMTLYIMYGFAKAAEFGVDVPKEVVQRGWSYLAGHFREEYAGKLIQRDCCWEFLSFLNYVASCYPDASWTKDALTAAQRKDILDFSFRHWKEHSPYLKCQLALTLKRMGRPQDAALVFSSVMDSARSTRDEGTFWAPEDGAWLWYNDTIESHAFALRTLMELTPDDAKKDGLVQWLFMNKKLNHWKSTRATAEVIYSIIHYLKKAGTLGTREDATVRAGGQTVEYVFDPERYTGKKNQTIIAGDKVDAGFATVTVEKESPGFVFASATWRFSTEQLPEQGSGDLLSVTRTYFKRERAGNEIVLKPLAEGGGIQPGDELEVHLSIRAKHPCEYVHLRDPRAAGLEPENAVSRYRWDMGIGWYEEVRDSGTNFFFEQLPQGEYTFKYRLRASMAGTFKVGPATLQSMYAPEFTAYSSGAVLSIR
jgi:alpha-2-macroglobulin